MNAPTLMTRTETNGYCDFLLRIGKTVGGRVGEYLTSAAKDLRLQADFGGEDQRRFGR